ncbi:hypothetical protein [Flavihumibacter profundi]|uniref:hypothetical protein n=1 Tax=Flavihumibacter profundi TaxID=2716883 RepID=UPI001CC6F6C5|nr:hypothetical protein [Flavihumibacter profundi]MBZ5857556.1 hypothetical protein [Flavihumibacter profundi]
MPIRLILLVTVFNYLNENDQQAIRDKVGSSSRWTDKKLIILLAKYFDFERLKTEPIIAEDILLYNFLLYDCFKGNNISFKECKLDMQSLRIRRSALLNKYENEVIRPQLDAISRVENFIQ